MTSSLRVTLTFPHWEYSLTATKQSYMNGKEACKRSPADHICHFMKSAVLQKMVPISPTNVQTNFDDVWIVKSLFLSFIYSAYTWLYCWYSGLIHLHSKY